MIAVVYHWSVREGAQEPFERAWADVTRAIRADCGSGGSRLHRAADGTYVAYAVWPSAEARRLCQHHATAASAVMSELIEATISELVVDVVDDLLGPPPTT
jgi:heme-degrading monooxygenase HmoA